MKFPQTSQVWCLQATDKAIVLPKMTSSISLHGLSRGFHSSRQMRSPARCPHNLPRRQMGSRATAELVTMAASTGASIPPSQHHEAQLGDDSPRASEWGNSVCGGKKKNKFQAFFSKTQDKTFIQKSLWDTEMGTTFQDCSSQSGRLVTLTLPLPNHVLQGRVHTRMRVSNDTSCTWSPLQSQLRGSVRS